MIYGFAKALIIVGLLLLCLLNGFLPESWSLSSRIVFTILSGLVYGTIGRIVWNKVNEYKFVYRENLK